MVFNGLSTGQGCLPQEDQTPFSFSKPHLTHLQSHSTILDAGTAERFGGCGEGGGRGAGGGGGGSIGKVELLAAGEACESVF